MMMRIVLFLLLLPFFSRAQTIHRKGNKIIYKGEVVLPGRSATDVFTGLQNAVRITIKNGKEPAAVQAQEPTLTTYGTFRLSSDYTLLRTAHYTLQLTAKDGGYSYRIDSVYTTEKMRDGGEKKREAKELLNNMEISGPVAEATEKQLNEMDMNFQKLLAVLKTSMGKDNTAKHE